MANTNHHKVRLLSLFLALLLMLGCLSATVLAAENKVVRVGYEDSYGIVSDPVTGVLSGYSYDYLMEISKYTGWEYEFIPVSWNEGLELLSKGELDLFGPMQKSADRQLLYDYPEMEMGFEYGAIYADIDENRFFYNDVASLDGITVGIEEGNYYKQSMDQYCIENNISVNYVYTSSADVRDGLKNCNFDVFVGGGFFNIPNAVVISKIDVKPFYYATTKGNTDVLTDLNLALSKISQDNAYFAGDLNRKYYGDTSISMPAFTREEIDFIKQHPTLTVACDSNWAPLEYYDLNSHTYRGINIALLEEIGRVSGLKFEFLRTETYEGSKILDINGKVDLLMGHCNPTAAELGVIYSDPIIDIPVMLVGRNTINLTSPMDVAIPAHTLALSQVLQAHYPLFNYIEYPNSTAVINALMKRDVDAAFLSTYVFDEFARNQSLEQYISIPTKVTFPQCIGISKALPPVVLNVINKSIKRISDDQISSIVFSNTVGRAYTAPLSKVIKENSFIIIPVLMLIFMTFFYISRRNQNTLKKIAYVDTLTGVSTLARFRLDTHFAMKTARPGEFMLVSLDIDNFKYINDSFGYDMGNQILKTISGYFLQQLTLGELVGRIGADNFIFLIRTTNIGEENLHAFISNNIKRCMESVLPEHYSITFSVGTYTITDTTEDFSLMLDKANFARKSIKGDHTLGISDYTEEMDKQMEWKKEVTISMELALMNHEFEVYLQPKYLLKSEELIGAEALIRWNHPEKGLLPPVMFISIFERNGFIRKLDMYVFEEVCALLRRWQDEGRYIGPLTISVNLSRMHLFYPHLVDELLSLTTRYGVSSSCIEIELTESIVLHNTTLLIDIMNQLHSAGFHISIDDFGSGYSSLNLLKDLPVDVLKIDKGFLSDSTDVSNGRVIIDSVTKMAKSLNLITVAEGVETKEQAEMLLGMGCDIAQGYYFAKPMPIKHFEKLM
ncbi:MAG: EAL domain-containing protein [Angelakisella sp.]